MKKKKIIKNAVIIGMAVVLVAVAVFFVMQQNQDNAVYNQYTVKTGNVENVVKRTGQMAVADVTDITLYNGVTVSEVLVRVNDIVQADTKIASLDTEALKCLSQDAAAVLVTAEKRLRSLDDEKTTDKIVAPVSGRIKEINKDNYESDTLMRISLDGKMKVVFTANEEIDIKNAKILVKTEAGKKYSGTIIAHEGMTYTVTISDETVANGAAVTIYANDTSVGTGTVEINAEYIIAGSLDNVSKFVISVNDSVCRDTALAELKSKVPTDEYTVAMQAYSEAQERQMELAALAADPYLYAGNAGVVSALYIADNTQISGTADQVLAAQISPAQPDIFVATIPENIISGIQIGMLAEVSLTAYPNRELSAEVSFINPVGVMASGSTSYEVHFKVEDADGTMLGMTGAVVLVSQKAENCVVLPMDLVQERDGGTYYVLVPAEDGTATTKEIEIGISNEDYVQITSGLVKGDKVLYTGTLSNQEQ